LKPQSFLSDLVCISHSSFYCIFNVSLLRVECPLSEMRRTRTVLDFGFLEEGCSSVPPFPQAYKYTQISLI
jgi:hypothetical protein